MAALRPSRSERLGRHWTSWRNPMHLAASQRVLTRLGIIAALALVGSLVLGVPALARGTGHDPFYPSASDTGGESGDLAEMWNVAHFDAAAQAHPVAGAAALFSQCRFDPMKSASYPALAANEHDVVVGDTSFGFADGTSCFNP